MTRALIVDADTVIYKAARRCERVIDWGDQVTVHADPEEGIQELDSIIDYFRRGFTEDGVEVEVVMALTDYDEPNWRNTLVYPAYKEHREGDGIRRPILWQRLRDYIHEQDGVQWTTIQRPSLEGDDVCGIMMTRRAGAEERICVSIDKDMRTIPGLHFNPDKIPFGVTDLMSLVETVTKEEADHFHLVQALAGDPTDGFAGCTGIGVKTADALIDAGVLFEQYEHEFKSGPRKGLTETRFRKMIGATDEPWETIISTYQKQMGLSIDEAEAEALTNARCARILRASDFSFKNKEVLLWTPR